VLCSLSRTPLLSTAEQCKGTTQMPRTTHCTGGAGRGGRRHIRIALRMHPLLKLFNGLCLCLVTFVQSCKPLSALLVLRRGTTGEPKVMNAFGFLHALMLGRGTAVLCVLCSFGELSFAHFCAQFNSSE
jgi:hypothetical protein